MIRARLLARATYMHTKSLGLCGNRIAEDLLFYGPGQDQHAPGRFFDAHPLLVIERHLIVNPDFTGRVIPDLDKALKIPRVKRNRFHLSDKDVKSRRITATIPRRPILNIASRRSARTVDAVSMPSPGTFGYPPPRTPPRFVRHQFGPNPKMAAHLQRGALLTWLAVTGSIFLDQRYW